MYNIEANNNNSNNNNNWDLEMLIKNKAHTRCRSPLMQMDEWSHMAGLCAGSLLLLSQLAVKHCKTVRRISTIQQTV